MENVIVELPYSGNIENFWGAVQIYTDKSHILNRKVCGSSNLHVGVCDDSYKDDVTARIVDRITRDINVEGTSLDEDCDGGSEFPNKKKVNSNINHQEAQQVDIVRAILQDNGFRFTDKESKNNDPQAKLDPEVKKAEGDHSSRSEVEEAPSVRNVLDIPWQELHTRKKGIVAVVKKIHPKQLHKFVPQLEVVLLDSWRTSVTYITRLVGESASALPRLNYSFRFSGTGISLVTFKEKGSDVGESDTNVVWLKNNVLPKLVKWALEIEEDGIKTDKGSLSLLNLQEYNQLYQKLKIKYGQPLVEKWTENTDPKKFVFEDVAIATYLILLWRNERAVKGITDYQTFVDMGCGNGLLVYILSREGHRGLGIDLKKRNIWDMFPDDVVLQEGVVEPSDKNLFPEYDWLIGNHSDELTPWLPVIAAKSKYTTRFFVIPCCAHDFDCKYRRKHAGISQYADYIRYIKEVGIACGFQMLEDRLRIPSTKRVCLIGQERTYSVDESPQILKAIDDFIRVRNDLNAKSAVSENSPKLLPESDLIGKRSADALWSTNFKAREAVQPVRNCTRLNEVVKHDLLATVVGILLEKKHTVEVDVGCPKSVSWDRGGSINLGDLAKRIGHQQLSSLKKECGGLQTLLRNHRHMFSIVQGDVSLKVPVPEWKANVPRDRIKTKPCWFHLNHYQNCPLPSVACIYAHGDDDIRNSNI